MRGTFMRGCALHNMQRLAPAPSCISHPFGAARWATSGPVRTGDRLPLALGGVEGSPVTPAPYRCPLVPAQGDASLHPEISTIWVFALAPCLRPWRLSASCLPLDALLPSPEES